ncbi:hypothetical protein GCM10009123_10540 [Kangiella japonica]|uniref:Uncharacterized protein n=1 Tax=Kangiella japonica TaxID=647384 RepID=A0ABN0SXF6_9GAMM
MSKSIKSYELHGSYDFATHEINIIKLNNRDLSFLTELKEVSQNKITKSDLSDIRTIVHEITHFLDSTTTIWGAEFNYRKNLYLVEQSNQRGEVLQLNLSELSLHHELNDGAGESLSLNFKIEHAIEYDNEYGVYISVLFYNEGGEVTAKVPTSMLALLECNAIASEILIALELVKSVDGYSGSDIEEEFNDFLISSNDIEYKLFLFLARKHFNFLPLESFLRLFKSFVDLSLNVEAIPLSKFANIVERTCLNKELGRLLSAELRRGSSRAAFLFKLILFSYGHYITCDDEEKLKLRETICKKPINFIHTVLMKLGVRLTNINEFGITQEQLKNQCFFDSEIFMMTSSFNRNLLKSEQFCFQTLKKLKYPDIFKLNNKNATLPCFIKVDLESKISQIFPAFSQLYDLYDEAPKFHLVPGYKEFYIR